MRSFLIIALVAFAATQCIGAHIPAHLENDDYVKKQAQAVEFMKHMIMEQSLDLNATSIEELTKLDHTLPCAICEKAVGWVEGKFAVRL